jgi:hypothetical protein
VCKLRPGDLCGSNVDCFENACNYGFCTTLTNPGGACLGQGDCWSHICKAGACAACTIADCASCKGGRCLAPSGAPCQYDAQCDSNSCVGSPFLTCK